MSSDISFRGAKSPNILERGESRLKDSSRERSSKALGAKQAREFKFPEMLKHKTDECNRMYKS